MGFFSCMRFLISNAPRLPSSWDQTSPSMSGRTPCPVFLVRQGASVACGRSSIATRWVCSHQEDHVCRNRAVTSALDPHSGKSTLILPDSRGRMQACPMSPFLGHLRCSVAERANFFWGLALVRWSGRDRKEGVGLDGRGTALLERC